LAKAAVHACLLDLILQLLLQALGASGYLLGSSQRLHSPVWMQAAAAAKPAAAVAAKLLLAVQTAAHPA
jgi:hypothetical protein